MENNKIQLLQNQTIKLDNVIGVLQKNFTLDEVEDDINILSVISGNLKELAKD